jgi:23S rRNA pseudouridine2605 synthase
VTEDSNKRDADRGTNARAGTGRAGDPAAAADMAAWDEAGIVPAGADAAAGQGVVAAESEREGEGEGERLPPLRLNKALAQAGFGSRRAAEQVVLAGRVEINGEVVLDLGRRVDPERDRLSVDGIRVVLDTRRRYWLLNKPAGVVTTASDERGRPTVIELVPDNPRVYPVGRLDLETEGLLLLTNDGDLAHRLMHPSYGVHKRYLAEVEQLPPGTVARLTRGVRLEDGPARAERARIVGRSGRRQMLEIDMVEGRNREVRRLLDAVGAPVRRLVRTSLGPLRLTGLAPGEHRPLTPEELRKVYKAVGL